MACGRTGGLWLAGGREAEGRTGRRRAKEGRTGGRGADGRTGGRHGDWRRTGRRADGRMRADGAQTGQISDRADGRTSRGFKRPRTLFPSSLSSAQTTRLIAERVCRALGSALGPSRGYVIFFFASNNIFAIQAQHYCEVCARIVLALSRIVTQNL